MITDSSLTRRLNGTPSGRALQEAFINSAHFPIANVLYEVLKEGVGDYFAEPDLYILITSACIQAIFIAHMQYVGRPKPFLGNLIGPALYTLIEMPIEGMAFFANPNHTAYWAFAALIGLLRLSRSNTDGVMAGTLLVVENVTRASILSVMYAFFEIQGTLNGSTFLDFFNDTSHVFVFTLAPAIGLFLGFSSIASLRRMDVLHKTAGDLRQLSEWTMGETLVSQVVENPDILSLTRETRVIYFMDIRGFTRWSEDRSPEVVVPMLNTFFKAGESVWRRYPVIIARLIADQLMLVIASPEDAVKIALEIRQAVDEPLRTYGLGAGAGLAMGPVIEGLIGSESIRSYDVIGDTANSAARLCSAAAAGEILVASDMAESVGDLASFDTPRVIEAKGKIAGIKACPLLSLRERKA